MNELYYKKLGIDESYSNYRVMAPCYYGIVKDYFIVSIDKEYGIHILTHRQYKAVELRHIKKNEIKFIKLDRYFPTDLLTFFYFAATLLFLFFGDPTFPYWTILLGMACFNYIFFDLIFHTRVLKLKTRKNELFQWKYSTPLFTKKQRQKHEDLKNKIKIMNSRSIQ